MVDTYLQPEVHIVITQSPGVDGTTSTARLGQIESDLAIVLARPAIEALDDVPDVDAAGATAGQSLLRNAANTGWEAGTPVTGISVKDDTLPAATGVTTLDFRRGLRATEQVPGEVDVTIDYAGTGSATSVARSDHTHSIRIDQTLPIPASGTLSSGTRPLVSGTVSGLDPARSYVIKGTMYLHARGDGSGASFARPRVTINGVNKGLFEDMRLVAGVLITEPTHHAGVLVTGVSSVAVAATVAFSGGDPAYIGAGELFIDVTASR